MPSQAEINWAKFRVTVVIISAIAILGVLVYLLTGGSLLSPKTSLYLYVDDASGLVEGSPVRVNGISVGKVDHVELTRSKEPRRVVRVVMTVEQTRLRSIPVDSEAQITADTMIGDRFIDISSGRAKTFMQPGGELRYQPPTDLMEKVDLTQFEQQLRKVDAQLRDIEAGKTRVGEFVRGEQLYSDLLRRVADVETGIKNAAATTGTLGTALYSDTLYRKIAEPVRRLDETLARIQSGQGQAGRLIRDTADYEKLRSGAANLRRTLEELRAGRGTGGAFLTTDAAWESFNRMVESLIGTVDRINQDPMFATSEMYDNLNGAVREMGATIRDFREDPKKYLRIRVF